MKERNSNIEVIRIVAMIFIMASHYVNNFYEPYMTPEVLTINRVFLELMKAGNKMGVNAFVLISGYFMINAEHTKNRIIKLCKQVWFYSIVLDIIAYVLGLKAVSAKNVIGTVFPVLFEKHWFVTCMVGLYLIIPFLNKGLKALTKEEHKMLCIVLGIMCSIIPTLLNKEYFFSAFTWFVVLYCYSAYLRLHIQVNEETKRLIGYVGLFGVVAVYASVILLDLVGTRIQMAYDNRYFFCSMSSVFTCLAALCIVGYSACNAPRYNKVVNELGAASFAVYLIHCSEIGRMIWEKTFAMTAIDNSLLIISFVSAIIMMYLFSWGFEKLRVFLSMLTAKVFVNKI